MSIFPDDKKVKPQEISLEEIQELLGDCKRCPLHESRNNIVFGKGNPHARIMIIGEAPGKNEDLQGEPFVGKAGKELDEYLHDINLSLEDVYIANVLKCRPPENRNPQVFEITSCAPYLREQIRSIWPDVIVTLGNFASKFVLKTDAGITALRGKVYPVGHFKVVPMFHPAAAIYDRNKVRAIKEDFKMLSTLLEDERKLDE
ncbi:MAG: uracil-DNA glycosylase [Coriobacteriia bacterium]|nr:uracil-DNA glycosylase [Coriobacteriia bacterium]